MLNSLKISWSTIYISWMRILKLNKYKWYGTKRPINRNLSGGPRELPLRGSPSPRKLLFLLLAASSLPPTHCTAVSVHKPTGCSAFLTSRVPLSEKTGMVEVGRIFYQQAQFLRLRVNFEICQNSNLQPKKHVRTELSAYKASSRPIFLHSTLF